MDAVGAAPDPMGVVGRIDFRHHGQTIRSPLSLFWTLAGVALAGVCIYFLDRRALRRCPELEPRQQHIAALALAIGTAPWLFLLPAY